MMNDYIIGQVLYVVVRGENRVRPMQVVEEILRKTVDGVHKTYMLYPGDDRDTISIHDLDADIYSSSDEVKSALIEKASTTINKIVDNAVEKASQIFTTAQVHEVTKADSHGARAS